MPKLTLLILSLVVVITTAVVTLFFNNGDQRLATRAEIDTAVNQAQFLYRQKKSRGEDLSNGPCITEALMPEWVADIAHNPREPIDDVVQNQCSSYFEGRAKHFVELDLKGDLIRAK